MSDVVSPVAGAAADALGYGGAIAIVAALTAASGIWVLVDMPRTQSHGMRHSLNAHAKADPVSASRVGLTKR